MAITLTQKLAAMSSDLDALIEKLGKVQGTTQANRSQIAGLLSDLAAAQAEQAATAQKMEALAGPVRELRSELAGIADAADAGAKSLRGIGVASSGGASSGGMQSFDVKQMSAAELQALARAIKPELDGIDSRSR